jgi:hypothetical protein
MAGEEAYASDTEWNERRPSKGAGRHNIDRPGPRTEKQDDRMFRIDGMIREILLF